jgi:presequence protease
LYHEDAPALAVISKLLRSMFLHKEIREKGGAYGGFASYQMENGLFSYGSYRDPHIYNTLMVYDEASKFITSGDYTDENVKESILQICADIDRLDTPSSAALKSFYRKLIHLTDEMRRTFKTRLLQLDRARVLSVAEKYFGGDKKAKSVAVISNESALKEANAKLKDSPLTLHRI